MKTSNIKNKDRNMQYVLRCTLVDNHIYPATLEAKRPFSILHSPFSILHYLCPCSVEPCSAMPFPFN